MICWLFSMIAQRRFNRSTKWLRTPHCRKRSIVVSFPLHSNHISNAKQGMPFFYHTKQMLFQLFNCRFDYYCPNGFNFHTTLSCYLNIWYKSHRGALMKSLSLICKSSAYRPLPNPIPNEVSTLAGLLPEACINPIRLNISSITDNWEAIIKCPYHPEPKCTF